MLSARHLRARYDLIHVHSVPDFEVFATVVPRLLGARVVLDIHDIVPEFYASKFKVTDRSAVIRLLRLVERLSISYSNHVIISNHLWYAKLVQRSCTADKCTVVLNYPDLRTFSHRPRSVVAHDRFVMCYPGTLNWHQGVDLAVMAMALLRDHASNFEFLIIGDGPDHRKLCAMVQEQGLEDIVVIRDPVPIEQIADIMANVDLGVVPKRSDSFGNEAFSTKIMEFMAMGVPVLAARTRIDQYYFGEDLVAFFESGSSQDLAASILELSRNPKKCDFLRNQGLRFVGRNNWDVKQQEYLTLVDGLVRRPRSLTPKAKVAAVR
jgi:glycosyltransferase involved in cell wall biosynthesis